MNAVKKIIKAREFTSFLFLAALFLAVGLINPAFLSLENVSACFNSTVVYTLIAEVISPTGFWPLPQES